MERLYKLGLFYLGQSWRVLLHEYVSQLPSMTWSRITFNVKGVFVFLSPNEAACSSEALNLFTQNKGYL